MNNYPEPPFQKLNIFLDRNDFALAIYLTAAAFLQLLFFDRLVMQPHWLLIYSVIIVFVIVSYLLISVHTVLRILIGHRKVKLYDVFFFVSSYMLFILVFALCYGCIYHYGLSRDLQVFRSSVPDLRATDFLYYSGVVMTTLGFGDIVPLGNFVKLLTVFQSSLGQILLVLSIGSVIGRMQNNTSKFDS